MTITQAQIEGYRASWFPPGLSAEERSRRPALFARALMNGAALAASEYDERAELFRRVVGSRPAQFRARTNPLQAAISQAIDGALSRRADKARAQLRSALAADDRRRRTEAARQHAEAQRQALARQEHGRTVIASLGQAAERARRRRLVPPGPVRLTF